MVPTCELLHMTAPSAWTSGSLTGMSLPAFSNCLELMGQDPFLASYQRSEVFKRVKEVRTIPGRDRHRDCALTPRLFRLHRVCLE